MASSEILDEIESELADVRAQRDALLVRVREKDEREAHLEGLAKGLRDFLEERLETKNVGGVDSSLAQRLLLSLPPPSRSVLDLAELALREQATQDGLDTHGLIAAMEEHGFSSKAQNVYLSVFGSMNRAAKRPDGPIVKVDKRWALREWYPDGVPVQDDDDEQEQEVPR